MTPSTSAVAEEFDLHPVTKVKVLHLLAVCSSTIMQRQKGCSLLLPLPATRLKKNMDIILLCN